MGKWVADANETVKSLIFVFKLSDGVLTGTAEAGSLGPVNLSNGKVDGDQISFEVTRSVLMTKVTTKYTGTIAGEVINLRGSNIRGSMDPGTPQKVVSRENRDSRHIFAAREFHQRGSARNQVFGLLA